MTHENTIFQKLSLIEVYYFYVRIFFTFLSPSESIGSKYAVSVNKSIPSLKTSFIPFRH